MLRRSKVVFAILLTVGLVMHSEAFAVGTNNENTPAMISDVSEVEVLAGSSASVDIINLEGLGIQSGVLKVKHIKPKKEAVKPKVSAKRSSEEAPKQKEDSADYESYKVAWTGTFSITGYCNCRKCCGIYSPEAGGKGTTKSGKVPKEGRTIAADTSILPMGTKVMIKGHVYTVEDEGSAVKGNTIDMFFDSHSKACKWGRRTLKVKVLK